MKIGVIGNGFVGKATSQLKCDDITVLSYDTRPEACEPLGITVDDLLSADVIFVSVPTPMSETGECYTNIVRNVVNELKAKQYSGFIVVRSTVPVGTCDDMGVFFMPEFLTEKNAMADFFDNEVWILGIPENCEEGAATLFREKMSLLFELAWYNGCVASERIHFCSCKEAEMTKMFRNCILAVKTSFCNEMYKYCGKLSVDYNTVREMVEWDTRIGGSHTKVPGPDGHFGFGGTCFPKDLNSLCFEMDKVGVSPLISRAAKMRNEIIDRPERDWEQDKGRAVVDQKDPLVVLFV
jgi:nucleotide sugar dehydrogenase